MSKKSARDPLASKLDSAKQTSLRVLADASGAAAPKLRDTADKARPQVEAFAEKARPQVEALADRAEGLAERARPQVEAFADKANDQVHAWADKLEAYRPEATERAGRVASNAANSLANVETPQLIDDLAVRVTGDKKAVKKARKALTNAGKRIQKDTARKSGGGKTAVVWTLVIGSAAGIGYYVWKKAQPVEDPWSTPLPNNRPADARPVGSTPASHQATAPEVSQTAVPETKSAEAAADSPSTTEDSTAESVEDKNAKH
ncbi:hypothetical protein [Brevibacterium marinum]|uniref:ElaB/YqjD/DUF883 family membrane-anchored ribosome-binding protein n=1 Tax=Brevibacterium marinum TaxID=418643 RepID=A0A846RY20_9MICO|nr:hypothetical protein [Brevibacterium marinum]NJC55563.1 ElaB/YqjD/DUF883 family membrane-anchored ribosome-binding protein [Brevibacterium marinum]